MVAGGPFALVGFSLTDNQRLMRCLDAADTNQAELLCYSLFAEQVFDE